MNLHTHTSGGTDDQLVVVVFACWRLSQLATGTPPFTDCDNVLGTESLLGGDIVECEELLSPPNNGNLSDVRCCLKGFQEVRLGSQDCNENTE